jgi:hypothetical protein
VSQLSALDGTEAEIDRFSREATADQDR